MKYILVPFTFLISTTTSTTSAFLVRPKDNRVESSAVIENAVTSVFPSPLEKVSSEVFPDVKEEEYWYNPSIHSFGNIGILGGFHAAMAPIATKIIDNKAYGGINVRNILAKDISKSIGNDSANICDLCCGVGMSTRALQAAFPNADILLGIDTSPQMLGIANAICKTQEKWKFLWDPSSSILKRPTYKNCNAEKTGLEMESIDLVTIMYGFHEIPYNGRSNVLREARRILKPGGMISIVDISPTYEPSKPMLSGEPYVLEYQQNIEKQLKNFGGFYNFDHQIIVPGHVSMFTMIRR